MSMKPSKAALSRYQAFHGKKYPTKVQSTFFHVPENLILLGRAVDITYESDKLNGGGTGRKELFRHAFSRSSMLYTDEKGKQLYILGPALTVKSPGIIN